MCLLVRIIRVGSLPLPAVVRQEVANQCTEIRPKIYSLKENFSITLKCTVKVPYFRKNLFWNNINAAVFCKIVLYNLKYKIISTKVTAKHQIKYFRRCGSTSSPKTQILTVNYTKTLAQLSLGSTGEKSLHYYCVFDTRRIRGPNCKACFAGNQVIVATNNMKKVGSSDIRKLLFLIGSSVTVKLIWRYSVVVHR